MSCASLEREKHTDRVRDVRAHGREKRERDFNIDNVTDCTLAVVCREPRDARDGGEALVAERAVMCEKWEMIHSPRAAAVR